MKRVAFITGGSRGIGFGIATQLAQAGFNLAINGLRPAEAVSEAVAALEALGAEVLYCPGDVSSAEARSRMVADIEARFGALHVLVNNAGIAPRERRDILEATEESFTLLLTTNLQGPYFLTQ